MKIYCVWRLYLDGKEDTLIAICSTFEKANSFKDMPNYDIEISEEVVDSDTINMKYINKI